MDWVTLVAVISVMIGLGLAYMLFAEVFGQLRGEASTEKPEKRRPHGVTEEERNSLTRVSTSGRFVSKTSSTVAHGNPLRSPSGMKADSDRQRH